MPISENIYSIKIDKMYKEIIKYQLLVLTTILLFVSCSDEQAFNVTDLGLVDGTADLLVVDGGDNVTLDVQKGHSSYFDLKIRDTGSNTHLGTGTKGGWTLQWESPVSHDTTYEGVTLYSTFNEEYWKPINYLLNNRDEIVANDTNIDYREIQAAIWLLLDFTDFDLETSNLQKLPEDMVENGQHNFDPDKAKQIVNLAKSEASSYEYTPSSTYAVVAKSSSDNEIIIIEESQYAFELVDLREEFDMVVAWDVNDNGQIAGGNLFVDSDGTSVTMGNMFARSMNNNAQVVGNSGQQAAYWDAGSGVVELSDSYESDISQANAINDQGEIAGEIVVEHLLYEDEDYGDVYEEEFYSFLWSEASGDQSIGNEGWAFGINNSGEVVGLDYTVTNRAYIWNNQDGIESLGTFSGFSSARAHSINSSSQVAGSVLVSQDGSAAKLSASASAQQEMKQLDLEIKKANLDGVYAREHILEMMQTTSLEREFRPLQESLKSDISGLNRSITAKMSAQSSQSQAFIWDESFGMMNLGTLGGDWSTAWDLNDHGHVVGYSSIGDGESRAFFWDDENGLIELPTLGGNSLARAINNEGQIVGYSYDDSGNFYPVMWKISIRQAT